MEMSLPPFATSESAESREIHTALNPHSNFALGEGGVSDVELIIQKACYEEQSMQAVLSARGVLAEQYLGVMQKMLDTHCDDDTGLRVSSTLRGTYNRYKLRCLLVKLSTVSDTLPSSLFLQHVLCTNQHTVEGGAFADIFCGTYHGTEVALKRLRVFQNMKQSVFKAVCREALVWRQLSHLSIQPFLGVDRDTFPHQFCLVSPWQEYGNIINCMSTWEGGDPGIIQIDKWLLEIAQGLAYLHKERVVHGDLRGPNILIDDNLHVRLTDFGLTVLADATSHGSYHGGAARWMAPELLNPEQFGLLSCTPTFSSDIYAFACVCIEIYTGRQPFAEISHHSQVILSVLNLGVRPDRPTLRTGREMSERLWHLVQLCWKQQAGARPIASFLVECLETRNPPSEILLTQRTLMSRYHTTSRNPSVPDLLNIRLDNTYLLGVTWDFLGAWDTPSNSGCGRVIQYVTGPGMMQNVDDVASILSSPSWTQMDCGTSITFSGHIHCQPITYVLTAADYEPSIRYEIIPWTAGRKKYVYQQTFIFYTESAQSSGPSSGVRTGHHDWVYSHFRWKLKCNQLEVTAQPRFGPVWMEAVPERCRFDTDDFHLHYDITLLKERRPGVRVHVANGT